MSYLPTGSLSPEQTAALLDIEPAAIRKLDPDRRMELAIQHAEHKAREKEAFWTAVSASIPLLALFGITRLIK